MSDTTDIVVERSCFDVRDVESRYRYEIWRDSISCIFDIDVEADIRSSSVFYAVVDSFRLGNLLFAETDTVEHSWARRAFQIARDDMDHYMVQLFTRGTMTWETGRDAGTVQAGEIIVFDLSREMESRTSSFTNLSLVIPRQYLAPLLRDPDALHMQHLPNEQPVTRLLREYILMLNANCPSLHQALVQSIIPSTLSMVAACLNGGSEPSEAASCAERDHLTAYRVKSFIRQNLHNPLLDVQRICDHCNVSRSNLYRLFSDEGGVREFIREERLMRALQSLIERPDQKVSSVARRHGFMYANDFSRSFRRRFDMAPSELRSMVQSPVKVPPQRLTSKLDRKYEKWLRRLASAS